MSHIEIATGRCYIHGGHFAFNPETVVCVLVDPQTGLPPDVDAEARPIEPAPGAVARSVQQPICDSCVSLANVQLRAAGRPEIEYARDRERR